MFKLDLEKGRNQRSNCQHPLNHRKSKRTPEKTSTSALLTMLKPLTVWITTKHGKFFKRWEYQNTWPASWEICTQIKKQQLELDREQQTGSKLEKEYIKTVYCHPVYLTYAKYIMRNVRLDKVQAGIKISGWNICVCVYIYIFFFISFSIMVCHRILNMFPVL